MAEAPTVALPDRTRMGSSGHGARWFSAALLILSCLLLGVFLLDGRFRVRSVDVEGATLVEAQAIVAAANLTGVPIFLVDAHRVERQVAEAFGCFDRVRVQAKLPDHVRIAVSEKGALLLWENQGTHWWIDGQGAVLGIAARLGSLPVVHDHSGLPVVEGSMIAGVPWDYVGAMVTALPGVREFEYTLEDGLIVRVTTAGWPVYLGTKGDADHKVIVLRELTAALMREGTQVEYIDLKNERRPAVKLIAG
ncbi:MAG: FtsQ-type POTRA domain-containing protein [Chloroflexi bacterium]|nr:FtsQ-type POTRA domain-containing protein [Chloroflexota bacterium]